MAQELEYIITMHCAKFQKWFDKWNGYYGRMSFHVDSLVQDCSNSIANAM